MAGSITSVLSLWGMGQANTSPTKPGESPAKVADREGRTMRCEYTTGCHLTCPSDGKVIQYRIQIITEAMVMVEEIIEYIEKLNGEPMFQEHLTQDLAVKFKCKCKTFATHQGVAVDCMEDLR